MTLLLGFALAAALTTAQKSAIDKLVTSTMAREHIAGATVAVAIDDQSGKETPKMTYVWGFGYADISAKSRAGADTVYPIGSVTKQFTAACVLLLAQDGKLSIDDPFSKYVPGLPWGDRVTLRHLLDQESGIVDFRLGSNDFTTPLSQSAVVNRLQQTDLLFAPGSKYEYSNSNYYLLGMVVEKASGTSYPQFLQQRILGPLGLSSTWYADAKAQIPKLARGFIATKDGPQPITPEIADWSFAAGAIASTATDITRWDDALRKSSLLNDDSRREMFSPGVLDNGSLTSYAFGWDVVRHNRHREIWHNGEVTGYHAMNATYPDDRTDVVVLTNTGGTYAADELAVQIFDVLHPFQPTAADRATSARLKEWIGRIERGDVDRTQLTGQMSTLLTGSNVQGARSELRSFGKLKTISLLSVDEDASGRSYSFSAKFASKTVTFGMGIDADGKIASLFFHL